MSATHFKQIVFFRVKREVQDKYKPPVSKVDDLRKKIENFLNWSTRQDCYLLKECFLNFQNKSIFNSGLVVRQLSNEKWEVELVLTTPTTYALATIGTQFVQQRNYINYTFQRHFFYSQPLPFFESLDYKELFRVDKTQIQYFSSHLHGLEIFLYPKQCYLQIIETYPIEIEPQVRVSMAKKLIIDIQSLLSNDKVVMIDNTLKPEDFNFIEQP